MSDIKLKMLFGTPSSKIFHLNEFSQNIKKHSIGGNIV